LSLSLPLLLAALVTIPFCSVVYYYKGTRLHGIISTWLQRPSRFDGRIVVVSGLLTYFGVLGALSLRLGLQKAWMRLGVPAMIPPFVDLRFLLVGLDCQAHGFDIFQSNSCMGSNGMAAWDYPRAWLLFSGLGVTEQQTTTVGIILALLVLAMLVWRLGRLNVRQGFLLAVLVCSPAVMLGIERGNVDLAMFVILAIALYLLGSQRIRVRLGGYGCIMVAAILKLYPAFAFLTLAKEKKNRSLLAGVIMVCLGVYGIVTVHDIVSILPNVPRETYYSYGASVLFEGVNLSLSATKTSPLPPQLGVLIAGLLLLSGVFLAHHSKEYELGDERHVNAFLTGAGIFLGSFIVLGNNYDYRLIFLLLTMPQLLIWNKTSSGIGRLSLMAIAAIALRLWLPVMWISDVFSWWLVWFYSYSAALLLRSYH